MVETKMGIPVNDMESLGISEDLQDQVVSREIKGVNAEMEGRAEEKVRSITREEMEQWWTEQQSSIVSSNNGPSTPPPGLVRTDSVVSAVRQVRARLRSLRKLVDDLETAVGQLFLQHQLDEPLEGYQRRQVTQLSQSIDCLNTECQSLILTLDSLLRTPDQPGGEAMIPMDDL